MSLAALVDEKETSYGAQPIAFNYSTFGEQAAAALKYQQDNLNYSSERQVYDEEIEKRNKTFFDIHGTNGLNLSGLDPQEAMAKSMDSIVLKGRAEGKPQYNDIMTTEEVNQAALNRSRNSKVMYDDVMSRAAPESYSGVASFFGQAGGWFSDPIHIATLGVGGMGSAGKGILSAMSREAAINAGTEIPIQAAVLDYQKKLGHDYTLEDAATSVVFAGAMGAGFVGGIHVAGMAAQRAGKFSGFTPEQLSFLDFFSKREAIETPPVKTVDSAVQAAHTENVAMAINAFAKREPITDFNPISVPKKFTSPDVNAEHVAVIKEFEQSGQKGLGAFAENKFMESIREELAAESALPRGDMVQLSNDIKMLTDARVALKKQINATKSDAAWSQDVNKIAEINTMTKTHDELLKQEAAKENLFETTRKAVEADTKLAEIEAGNIPKDIETQLKTFKQNVKKAKDIDNSAALISDANSAAKMMPEPLLTRADVEERIAFSTSPEYQKMVDKEYMDIIMSDPDLRMQNPDTGELVSAKALVDEIQRDEAYVDSIKSCMVGTGAKK